MTASRYRYSLRGFDLALTYYPRGHPIPGIEAELETPWASVGGYVHV